MGGGSELKLVVTRGRVPSTGTSVPRVAKIIVFFSPTLCLGSKAFSPAAERSTCLLIWLLWGVQASSALLLPVSVLSGVGGGIPSPALLSGTKRASASPIFPA